MPAQGFQGLRVLTLESRRATEISRLIENYQGIPTSAPAMREVPLEQNTPAIRFAENLITAGVDYVVFETGVGARALRKVIEGTPHLEAFLAALRRVKVVARGPKPQAVLREWDVPILFTAPEPCTWREVLRGLDDLPGGIYAQRVAVQEYGASNVEFLAALRERGAVVTPVAVYQWELPTDTQPLRNAIDGLLAGTFDVMLFTTSVQVAHLFRVAEEGGKAERLKTALSGVVIASIGPSTSEALRNFAVHVDLEPSHPKMGVLVKEAAESARSLLAARRAS